MKRSAPPRIPWLALIVLIASVVVFWVLPFARPSAPVQVIFEGQNPSP